MRVDLPRLKGVILASGVWVSLSVSAILSAQPADFSPLTPASAAPEPYRKLFIYSQRPLPEEMWTALFTALSANLPEAAAKVPPDRADPEFIRGDDRTKEDLTGQTITVYLRGDCRPSVPHQPFPHGEALGWVNEAGGVIVPIIHVECSQIGEAISGRTQWMNRDKRTAAMSEAIARVVLHEWVHVATQSGAHGSDGITKAMFSADDLLCGDQTPSSAGKRRDCSKAMAGDPR